MDAVRLDDPPEPRTAPTPSPAAALTDDQDEHALRAATYLAIWGEPLPPDCQTKPPHQDPKLTPIDPWGETANSTPAPARR